MTRKNSSNNDGSVRRSGVLGMSLGGRMLAISALLTSLMAINAIKVVEAAGGDRPESTISNGYYTNKVQGDAAVSGVVLIILGLFYTFLAHRHPKITLYSSIWIVWFAVAYYVGVKVNPPHPSNMPRRLLYLFLAMIIGGLAMLLVKPFSCWHIRENYALIFQGGMAGIAFSFYTLSFYENGLVTSNGGRAAYTCFWVIFGVFLNLFHPRYMAPTVYPVIGAYLFMIGVDCFARTGWIVHLAFFTHAYPDAFYHINRGTMSEIVATLVLGLMGGTFQRHQLLYWEKSPFEV